MPEPLRLHFTAQGEAVKLWWSDGAWSPWPYLVNARQLKIASDEVRDVLRDIALAYKDPSASYGAWMRDLAIAGAQLHNALFSPVDRDNIDDLVAYLADRSAGSPLTIFSDACVQIPWNFVFAGDVDAITPATNTIDDFRDFWSSHFKVRIRYTGSDVPPRRAIELKDFKTLFALHESRFRDAADLLATSSPEVRSKIDELLAHEVGATNNWLDCLDKWKQIKNKDNVLYIFAHSDGQTLYLNDEPEPKRYMYKLNPSFFQTYFKKDRDDKSYTLCFINGCRTADAEWGNGFLSVTSQHGFQGFIGSEAEITNEMATRYAAEFLHKLLTEGKSVGDTYDELREKCFPMSLWYSCYAFPDFRVQKEANP